jgi:hypothetical protein
MSKYGHRTGNWHEAIVNKLGGEDVADAFLRGEYELIKIAQAIETALLEFVDTVVIWATPGKLVAKERFVINTDRNAPVKINFLGRNFTAWFLSGDGKIEDTITEQTLYYHKLRQSSVDSPIIDELGGEAKAETTLSEMFCPMVHQRHGEDGALLNNDRSNIFYIRDQNGVLRAVGVSWDGDGWYVDAYSVDGLGGWRGGAQVFSRNSVLGNSEP